MFKKTGLLALAMCASAMIFTPTVASAQGRYSDNYRYYSAPRSYDRDAWRHEVRRQEQERARWERERQREWRRQERNERRYDNYYCPPNYYGPNYGIGFGYDRRPY
jgi:hypothetical protein